MATKALGGLLVVVLAFTMISGCAEQNPVESDALQQQQTDVQALARPGGSITSEISGTIADAAGTFDGKVTITRFANVDGALTAIGTLTGSLTDAAGNIIGTVTDIPIELPVTNAAGTCDILTLDLGPLSLDLLGLQVDLSAISLDIVAESGTGNLLGNLLCTVARLLDGSANLNAIANLLNNIVGALGAIEL